MGIVRQQRTDQKQNETYLFVDGAYLDKTISNHGENFFGVNLQVSYERLIRGSIKAFYYDAYPTQRQNESAEEFAVRYQEAKYKFDSISSCRGWHCNFGVTKGSGKTIRQKGVDLQLAMDAFTHCIRGNFRYARILTGDLDFFPLVRSLVQEGAFVEILCDPSRVSEELVRAADSRSFVNIHSIPQLVENNSLRGVPAWEKVTNSEPRIETEIKSGKYSKGEVKVVSSDGVYKALNYRRDMDSLSQISDTNLDRLLYFLKVDHFYIQWAE